MSTPSPPLVSTEAAPLDHGPRRVGRLRLDPGALRVGLALGALYLVWSTTYLGLRVLVAEVPATMLALGLRQLAAGAVLFAVARARGEAPPTRGQWLRSAPVGLLLFLGGNALVAIAERSVSSSVAAVVFASTPLWAAALGVLGGERVRRTEWAGIALGIASVLLLCGASLRAASWRASLLLLVSPLCWALGSMLSRKSDLPKGAMGAATPMLAGGALMLPVSAAMGESLPRALSATAVLAWGYLVVFGSVVGFAAYNYLLRHTRPAVAMSYAYVNPILAVALGAAVAGEGLPATTVVSVVLVLCALALLRRGEK